MRLGDREPNSIAPFVIANADSLKNCDKTQYYLAIEKLNTKHQKKKGTNVSRCRTRHR